MAREVGTSQVSADAAVVAHRLQQKIQYEIDQCGGSIAFDRYMEMALYEPGSGYYSAGLAKLGAAGDFITAPEVSPLFACCLARQCQQVLVQTGGGVLEFGAGSGKMAANLMLELEHLDALPDHYSIVEVSADLRARQEEYLRKAIPHLYSRFLWLDTLPQNPYSGVVLANEVIDALPVKRFRIDHEEVVELEVSNGNSGFEWVDAPASVELTRKIRKIEAGLGLAFADGYTSEVNLRVEPWIRAVSENLREGVLLLIDYGYPRRAYYHADRRDGTLTCHYHHRVHSDPLVLTGLQDISAFVDFTAVAETTDADLTLEGYTTQAHFLIGCGLDDIMRTAAESEPEHYFRIAQQAKTLTLPEEMGERFKVIALAHDFNEPLLGFSVLDHRSRL